MRDVHEHSTPIGGLPASLERRLGELLGRRDVRIALEIGGDRCSRRRAAFRNLGLGEPLSRSDDAPIVRGGLRASLAHCREVCLAAAAPVPVACDLGTTVQEDHDVPLSPEDRHLAQVVALHTGEQMGCAALRVRGARVCLRQLGLHYGGSLSIQHHNEDAVVLTGAGATIASILSPNALLISVSCAETEARATSLDKGSGMRSSAIEPAMGQETNHCGGGP